uniref:MICOS complex subunit n=1 Tax=Globodera rostochiensis TaxID=31243 RepID=A0A914HFL2_GLORO
MQSRTPEVTFKDRSVNEIHLENGYTFVIEQNLKHFGSVINVLAKFSEQILLQPKEDALVLSASSSARSAYAKVTLCRQFFNRLNARENLADGEVFCRLATKSLVHIFRNIAHPHAAAVPSCSIELDPQADFAYVHLQGTSSIRRCFVLSLREHAVVCDNVFNERNRLKNRVTAHAKLLTGLLAPLDCHDLELVVMPDRFTACRYIPREDYGKVRRTEVQIPVDHCEQYHIHVPTRVVVNLRELRPILQFADICGMSITLHFDRPGRPLIVAVEENVEFGAEFVLGTLDEQLGPPEQQQPQHNNGEPSMIRVLTERQRMEPSGPIQQQLQQQQNDVVPSSSNSVRSSGRRRSQDQQQHDPIQPADVTMSFVRSANPDDRTVPNAVRSMSPVHPAPSLVRSLPSADHILRSANPDRSVASPVQQPAPSPVQHPAPSPVQHPAPSPVQHPAPSPVQHPTPVQQPASTPVQHPAPTPVQQPASSSVQHPASTPVQHPAPSPFQHPAPSPFQHPAPTPVQHPAPTPVQQPASTPVQQPAPSYVELSPSPVSSPEHISQGELLLRPVPTLEFVDPNEIPLERYIFQRPSAVPRPEGMSVWEQDSDVGSRAQSSVIIGGGGGRNDRREQPPATTTATTGWMSKRSQKMSSTDSPRPTIVAIKDLPIYTEQASTRFGQAVDDIVRRPPTVGEEIFGTFRSVTSQLCDYASAKLGFVNSTLAPVRDAANATEDFFRDEQLNLLPRAGAITLGGMAGFVMAMRRGGRLRRLFYPMVGMLTMTAFCYPRETVQTVRVGIAHSQAAWHNFKEAPGAEQNGKAN